MGGFAASWPLAAGAQERRKVTLGLLVAGNPTIDIVLNGLREVLPAVGLVEGENLRIEARSVESAQLAAAAAELVRLKVDIIVTSLTPAAKAAKEATADIPIVMAAAGDPVATGLVASLARPGGNVTGVTTAGAEVAGKSLELVRELFPQARRVAVLANEVDAFTAPYLEQLRQGASRVGLEIDAVMGRPDTPQAPAFETMVARRADALLVQGSMARQETVELAVRHRLPSLGSNRSWPMSGGLMSYSASLANVYRQAADYIDKILKGRKPADLPVALATKFDLVVNLKAAKALGLTIPDTFLLRADEVIE